jgi:undecaprenyl-diphosphatase
MTPFFAALLGIVEGLTEYLPVSSTGHLILVSHLLGLDDKANGSFEIIIQLGAILAVLVHYRALLASRFASLVSGGQQGRALFIALMCAFVPTAIVGLALRKTIKAHLFGPVPVAIALIVGGIFMIIEERARRDVKGLDGLEHVTPKRAFAIGIGQCFSLIPGTSRSMSTIIAGKFVGLSTATSAEFSFLLALPTLGAATLYEGWKARHQFANAANLVDLAIGLVVSFFVAWAVIAVFIRYLQTRGLAPFGYYRIVIGIIVFLMLAH